MYKIILHPTDLLENHYDNCKKSVEIANFFGATLHLLHVIEPPSTLQLAQGLGFAELAVPAKEDALTVMHLLGESLNLPPEQQHVEIGSIKQKIMEAVNNLTCDLIIIGSHTPTALPAFLGSTAYAIIHQAKCDILTIRAS